MDFNFYRLVDQLLQPHTLLHVLLVGVLALAWRRQPACRRWLTALAVPAVLLYLISTPLASHLLLGSLEWEYPPDQPRPADCQAIVVLNAGIKFPDARRRQVQLDTDTMLRCVHAARLYHQEEPCYVIVTGGPERRGGDGPTCGQVMKDFLLELGVSSADILVEETSLSTYENAVECRKLLEPHGIERIVLVTDATHMLRSERCFRKLGIEVVPSACRHEATELKLQPEMILPNPKAAQDSRRVFHEWVGLVWYKWHGRI